MEGLDLPHTWNSLDGQDGGNDYRRGPGVYKKKVKKPEFGVDERVYLQFHGVNASAKVFLNEKPVCSHDGGYSTFRVDVTDELQEENQLMIEVDNSVNDKVYPQKADFTFYGGIYRDVEWLIVNKAHFDLDYYGGPGLKYTTRISGLQAVDAQWNGSSKDDVESKEYSAQVLVTVYVNKEAMNADTMVKAELTDAEGYMVAEKMAAVSVQKDGCKMQAAAVGTQEADRSVRPDTAGQGVATEITLEIPKAHLWDGLTDPYLYTLTVKLLQTRPMHDGQTPSGTVRDGRGQDNQSQEGRMDGQVLDNDQSQEERMDGQVLDNDQSQEERMDVQILDEISCNCGIRTFTFSPKDGFYLNGRHYPLHGVSRHQDRKEIGNAISRENIEQDMALIQEVGANTIRLAHYQHDQYFYDLCDKCGMIVWAEIPYISEHMPNGRENTFSQMKELIVQNFNHPSIVTWGISNEITISGGKYKKDMLDNHRALQALCKKMDPARPTTLACFAMCLHWNPVAHITDLVGWNLYLGWYVPGLFLNDLWIGLWHFLYPGRPLCYSEYGAEGMPNLHSARPRRGDNSEEYQNKYHEFMLKCFERHPYLWGTYVWNMFDFAADARNQGGEPGMNHKGLVTFDRSLKKDSFYLYKAYWTKEPFVYLAGKRYEYRTGKTTTVTVYSNEKEVSLYNNGKFLGTRAGKAVFKFRVKLEETNKLEVYAGEQTDSAVIYKTGRAKEEYRLKKGDSSNWM